MIFLIKLWIFNIDFGTIVSFLFGILIGMILMCLIYAIMVLLSLRDKKYQVKVQANDLKAKEAEDMIHIAEASFLDKDLRGDLSKGEHFKNVCEDLVYGIASRFFPDSKYPLLELTIDESLELITYLESRIEEILNKKILKLVKRLKVSDIYSMTRVTTAVVDSKAFEVTKEVGKVMSIAKKIINTVNPVWWFKKLTSDVILGMVMTRLYVIIIGILGEEAYKVYSKSFKDTAEDIDSNVNALVEELDSELKAKIQEAKEEKSEAKASPALDTSIGKMRTRYATPVEKKLEYQALFTSDYPLLRRNTSSSELLLENSSPAVLALPEEAKK